MRRLPLPLVLAALLLMPLPAEALRIQDLIDLTKAGLGDDILIALIEVDRTVFPVDPETLKQLKDAGVSERVILAVVRSGRTPPVEPPVVVAEPQPYPEPPPPPVVVIEHHEQVREVPVAVPIYVPVPAYRTYPRQHDARVPGGIYQTTLVPTQLYPPTVVQPSLQPYPHKGAEPVYWGHGGKLRPDAWKPDK